MGKGCKILFEDCDPTQAEDRGLPSNSYVIEYLQEGITKFDIVTAPKQVDIFDEYYDKYKKDFITMRQTEGRVNPKMYGYTAKEDKKKKK